MQYGGLALRYPEKYNDISQDKSKYEKALFDMIEKATDIECISHTSVEGFIFTIKVNEEDAVFNALNEKSEFEKPVTTVLLKLIIAERIEGDKYHFTILDKKLSIDKTKTIEKLVNDKNASIEKLFNDKEAIIEELINKKATIEKLFNDKKTTIEKLFNDKQKLFNDKIVTTEILFNEEIKTQYQAYKNTLNYNNVPICPSIIYNAYIFDKKTIIDIISIIKSKVKEGTLTYILLETLHILYKVVQGQPKIPALGIIGMEFAEGYQTLTSYIDGSVTTENDIYTHEKCETDCKCMSDIIVNIIRLFISSGIIHLDLHSENIMINTKSQKSLIIDFGTTKTMMVTQNNTEYEVDKYKVLDKTTKKPTEDALSNYLYTNLGPACNHIGKGEQLFMQDYLSGIVNDDEGCKKLLKLFLLIVVSERQLKYMTTRLPTIKISDFLNIIGLEVKLYDSNTETEINKMFFDIHMLNDKTLTLDDWIVKNIKSTFKRFFKNVILQTYHTFKDYYVLQDSTNPDNAISIRTHDSDKYKYTASKYTYKYKGGSSIKVKNTKRPTKRKQSRKKRRKLSNKNVGYRKMK